MYLAVCLSHLFFSSFTFKRSGYTGFKCVSLIMCQHGSLDLKKMSSNYKLTVADWFKSPEISAHGGLALKEGSVSGVRSSTNRWFIAILS